MVFGASGRIGVPTCLDLHKLGYKVIGIDKQFTDERLKVLEDNLHTQRFKDDYEYFIGVFAPNLVISCLPYTENLNVAKAAIDNETDYCDLGGHVETSSLIKAYYEKHNNSYKGSFRVFTDLGLAPGLINIYTQNILEQFTNKEVKNIWSLVGGIPVVEAKDFKFNYHCTWSVEGLLNEYFDDCVYINHGRVEHCSGLSHITPVRSNLLNCILEAFTTSGAAAHSVPYILERGFDSFVYKTLRYPGHAETISGLYHDFKCNKEDLAKEIKTLSDVAPVKDDLVIGMVSLEDHSYTEILKREFLINKTNEFTAMQIATAAPLVSVARMILEAKLPYGYLQYQDVVRSYSYFEDTLNSLGVDISND